MHVYAALMVSIACLAFREEGKEVNRREAVQDGRREGGKSGGGREGGSV
jgi:hypothetical protein